MYNFNGVRIIWYLWKSLNFQNYLQDVKSVELLVNKPSIRMDILILDAM